MGNTKISWAEKTWNPVTGCSHVSPGCEYCYAERLSLRFGWSTLPWTAAHTAQNVVLHPDRLDEPLRWRRPARIFVCSMSDLFHEQVPLEFIHQIWEVMHEAHRLRGHVFMVLTKRPQRMLEALGPRGFGWYAVEAPVPNPEPGIWLGVSAEDQRRADGRIPILLQTPAALRFVSVEPLLSDVNLSKWLRGGRGDDGFSGDTKETLELSKLDWVICGGESGGPGSRRLVPTRENAWSMRGEDWVKRLRDQCRSAGVPFFFKQWGGATPNSGGRSLGGRIWEERPE